MAEYEKILSELIDELIDIREKLNSTYISKLDCLYTQEAPARIIIKQYNIEIQKVVK